MADPRHRVGRCAGRKKIDLTDHWIPFGTPLTLVNRNITAPQIRLGLILFSDERLSFNQSLSCASCHEPERHFTDGKRFSKGADGKNLNLHTPTLYNVSLYSSFGWTKNGSRTLKGQIMIPLAGVKPVEMGFTNKNLQILLEDSKLNDQFLDAFGEEANLDNIVKALTAYLLTIKSPESSFDRYLFTDKEDALSNDALAGLALFFSPAAGCGECHSSFNLSGSISTVERTSSPVFHVTGVGGSTRELRAPSLRSVKDTAPYMHDGSIKSLEAVLDHYQSNKIKGRAKIRLSQIERRQLIKFLEAL